MDCSISVTASVSTIIGMSGIQWVNTGADVNTALRLLKALQQASEKFHLRSFHVSHVNGIMMLEYS